MSERQKWVLTVMGVVAVAVVYTLFNPMQHHWPLRCPFKLITGLQCPGCGGQRAAYALLHGHFREAVSCNLFLVYAGPYALALVVENLLPEGKTRRRMKAVIESRWAVGAFVVAFFVWLVVRNLLHI